MYSFLLLLFNEKVKTEMKYIITNDKQYVGLADSWVFSEKLSSCGCSARWVPHSYAY